MSIITREEIAMNMMIYALGVNHLGECVYEPDAPDMTEVYEHLTSNEVGIVENHKPIKVSLFDMIMGPRETKTIPLVRVRDSEWTTKMVNGLEIMVHN